MNIMQRRNPMAPANSENYNVGMAREIESNPTFGAITNQIAHEREKQAQMWSYWYKISGDVTGQQTTTFNLTIEQGTSFVCKYLTGNMFSYDAVNASDFPVPNSLGVTDWAGRGLSAQITDGNSGRQLTNGFVDLANILTPGYGLNFQEPYPFPYFFYPNSVIRFDVRNRDNANRSHSFEFTLYGKKVVTPS